jgi:hypothetical protein
MSCFPAVYRWCGWVGTVQLISGGISAHRQELIKLYVSWTLNSALFVSCRAVYHTYRAQTLQWGMKPILILTDSRCNNLWLQKQSSIVSDPINNKMEWRRPDFSHHASELSSETRHWRTGVTGRRGKRRQQQLGDLKGKKREYWKLREAALGRILCKTRFAIDYGPVVRQST